jgi:branched-chain amino acid transport system permease protein
VTLHAAQAAPPAARQSGRTDWLVLAVLTLVVALLPQVLPGFSQAVLVRTLVFAVMAAGWNVMSGYGGMFSFGHAAFFGIGAYADAYLLVRHGVSPWVGIVVGALLAAVFGVVISALMLRYRLAGAYFALATFAFAEMLLLLTSNLEPLEKTRGFNVPIVAGGSWSKLQFPVGSPRYVWVALALLVVAVAATLLLVRSRTGQYVMAIRDDEVAAASLGIPVLRYQLVAVAISAAITATAGGYYTQYYLFINPDLGFGSAVSVEAIVPAVIGGIGTVWGPVVGAAVIGPLSELTASVLRNPPGFLSFIEGRSGLDVATYAVLLIAIVVFLPRGVYGSVLAKVRR